VEKKEKKNHENFCAQEKQSKKKLRNQKTKGLCEKEKIYQKTGKTIKCGKNSSTV
jgi:hypothetical protein